MKKRDEEGLIIRTAEKYSRKNLPIVSGCLDCMSIKGKDEKGRSITVQGPCTKITEGNCCEIYDNPAVMWARPDGCIFPRASSTSGTASQEAGIRKFRRR